MAESSMRRWLSSPAPTPAVASLPDNDDLLQEILLRLPPLPSSLPRACLVCKRWRRLLTDPQFLRRFRAFHHRHPPCLGFFTDDFVAPHFNPTLDRPDHIPYARLSLPLVRDDKWALLGCRHGLALLLHGGRLDLTVWDPISGGQRRVALPAGLVSNGDHKRVIRSGALICNDGHAGGMPLEALKFKVVLLCTDDWQQHVGDSQAFASVYHSETGVWGDVISTPIKGTLSLFNPSALAGNSLCWLLHGSRKGGILVFDSDKESLAVIDYPVGARVTKFSCFQILRMEDSQIGLAILSDEGMQLWVLKADSGAVDKWMLEKTIELDKLLPLRSPMESQIILGYDEDSHVMFIRINAEVFTIQLKSMESRKLFETDLITVYHPYTSVYATGRCIGGEHVEAETLNST